MAELSHELDEGAVARKLRADVSARALADEAEIVAILLGEEALDRAARERVGRRAAELVRAVRSRGRPKTGVEAFLREYSLSSDEGVVLMCLAEALLRIPDPDTADRLIRDRVSVGDWEQHLGHSDSWLVNAATWGLMLTGRMVKSVPARETQRGMLQRLGQQGEPVIRRAMREALRILAQQFVMGASIDEAVSRYRKQAEPYTRVSYDMLGEAALTRSDAQRYHEAYADALTRLAAEADPHSDAADRPGISVKLSALHPRFEYAQHGRVLAQLVPSLRTLAVQAKAAGLGLTVDAEEADRLDLTLDVFEALYRDPALGNWNGFGIAVQAYQKRALPVLAWLDALAGSGGRSIPVRLVKGAYWDTEIKRAQERGLADYPVFTRKCATDVSYLVCARRLLQASDRLYPQFATHNAYTAAAVLELSGHAPGRFEFQRLHGMGESLYGALFELHPEIRCRIYAPVGAHAQLLPYLVRRLLENGANTSFVHRVDDPDIPVETLAADPGEQLRIGRVFRNPRIPLPVALYEPLRRNSAGIDLREPAALAEFQTQLQRAGERSYLTAPVIDGEQRQGAATTMYAPHDTSCAIGDAVWADAAQVRAAFAGAKRGFDAWSVRSAEDRARVLERAADRLEAHRAELVYLLAREGGRCIEDGLNEVREAADFCRYYAVQAQAMTEHPLPGPAGEHNQLRTCGRGVFACISPWNFPVAIFTGQIAAALAVGNAVVAKPAQQTSLCAMRVVELLHQAGVPAAALQFLPGPSSALGAALLQDPQLAGVAFTGSTATGYVLNRALADRAGPILPLIAETGGQNAMIVDSSALTEQVVADVLQSAFNSAGQRCSALRVLFLQEEVADRTCATLFGAMQELRLGDPLQLDTDVGPVIDGRARNTLLAHRGALKNRLRCEAPLPEACERGHFVAPAVFDLERMDELQEEVFGPMLHVIRYQSRYLDRVIDAINGSGFGLTLGIHSRIEATARRIIARARVGNVYVNRNMIGAVVGAQPFGGEGLSGTGPKAGGPHYLQRFAVERVVSTNTAAIGGNATLLSMDGSL